MKRWSKLKKRVENIFVKDIGLDIHCTVYSDMDRCHPLPRTWLQCDKQIIFDFPGMFLSRWNPEERSSIESISRDLLAIGELIHEYLETPKAKILDMEFAKDRWGFTDLLKIADRRIGKQRLYHKFGHLPSGIPHGMLLSKRLHGTPCSEVNAFEFKHIVLEKDNTGLPYTLIAKTMVLKNGYANPCEPPTIRVAEKLCNSAKDVFVFFAVEISSRPMVIKEHAEGWFYGQAKSEMESITQWIVLNQEELLQYWKNGLAWSANEIQSWVEKLKPCAKSKITNNLKPYRSIAEVRDAQK